MRGASESSRETRRMLITVNMRRAPRRCADHAAGKLKGGVAQAQRPIEPADLHLREPQIRHHPIGCDREAFLLQVRDTAEAEQQAEDAPADPVRSASPGSRPRASRGAGTRSHVQREPLGHVAANIEAEILHRRVIAMVMHAAAHALLHRLADRPVLAVHHVPEIHRIRRDRSHASRSSSGSNRKWQTISVRSARARMQDEYRGVVAREADEEIRVDEFALVALALVLVQRGKGSPRGRAAVRERVCARRGAARRAPNRVPRRRPREMPGRPHTAPDELRRSDSTRCSSRRSLSSLPRPA